MVLTTEMRASCVNCLHMETTAHLRLALLDDVIQRYSPSAGFRNLTDVQLACVGTRVSQNRIISLKTFLISLLVFLLYYFSMSVCCNTHISIHFMRPNLEQRVYESSSLDDLMCSNEGGCLGGGWRGKRKVQFAWVQNLLGFSESDSFTSYVIASMSVSLLCLDNCEQS